MGGQNYLGVAAGSGITPILSIIKQVLFEQPEANFTFALWQSLMETNHVC